MARFDGSRASELIRRARADAEITPAELAQRAGLRQPSLAQLESGKRNVSGQMSERVLRAANYRPSLPLAEHAEQVNGIAACRGLSNVRVFGSAARGEDGYDSDIDLLVTPKPGVDLFDLAVFADEVSRLTGFPVDVIADTSDLSLLQEVAREAIPL